ncbi:DUF1707 SHOCT-like domain-containing protein [Corynebacterium tapiri]|uniref:DUF1707 domain-containing protein n=1 Tax=Corynebacterium tapiri TaxID=1448266 RepID=A0A5C4U1J3_9CORY|nr:DUF1707 domain-containing protein [Corynebacterium tapiri]TNL95070.1 DUF1707 domain-containing protein [Corynebacterium tapiri]
MSTPFDPRNLRLSDNDRANAMNTLGRAFADGRLSMTEYDERCQQIGAAQYRADLDPLFADIPFVTPQPANNEVAVYTRGQVEKAYRSSRNVRAGILGVATMVWIPVSAGLANFHEFFSLSIFLLPALWFVLYVLKPGPQEWYAPKPAKVERERMREIRMASAAYHAELQAQHTTELMQKRMQRKQLASELQMDAMQFARKSFDRFK